VEHDYIYGGSGYSRAYIEYLMSARKEPGESYTYGERLTRVPLTGDKLKWWHEVTPTSSTAMKWTVRSFEENGALYLNQMELLIWTYKNKGHRNNQMVLQVAHPRIHPADPPCQCSIDTAFRRLLHFRFISGHGI
jgi:thymidylate synthase